MGKRDRQESGRGNELDEGEEDQRTAGWLVEKRGGRGAVGVVALVASRKIFCGHKAEL